MNKKVLIIAGIAIAGVLVAGTIVAVCLLTDPKRKEKNMGPDQENITSAELPGDNTDKDKVQNLTGALFVCHWQDKWTWYQKTYGRKELQEFQDIAENLKYGELLDIDQYPSPVVTLTVYSKNGGQEDYYYWDTEDGVSAAEKNGNVYRIDDAEFCNYLKSKALEIKPTYGMGMLPMIITHRQGDILTLAAAEEYEQEVKKPIKVSIDAFPLFPEPAAGDGVMVYLQGEDDETKRYTADNILSLRVVKAPQKGEAPVLEEETLRERYPQYFKCDPSEHLTVLLYVFDKAHYWCKLVSNDMLSWWDKPYLTPEEMKVVLDSLHVKASQITICSLRYQLYYNGKKADKKVDMRDIRVKAKKLFFGDEEYITREDVDLDRLKEQYPELFGLDTSKGLVVYASAFGRFHVYCQLGEGPAKNLENELAPVFPEKPLSVAQVRSVLETYGISRKNITIVPYQNSLSSNMLSSEDLELCRQYVEDQLFDLR